MSYLAMLSLGIFSIAWWPVLPRLEIIFAVMVCSIPLCISLWNASKLRLLFSLLMGVSIGLISGHLLLKDSLPAVFDGEDILLSGTIVNAILDEKDVEETLHKDEEVFIKEVNCSTANTVD